MNVAALTDGQGGVTYLDLEVTNRSGYTTNEPSSNGFLNNRFAQINLACGQSVDLRVTIYESCATAKSCNRCKVLTDVTQRLICYGETCSCYGTTVDVPQDCTNDGGATTEADARAAYSCANMNNPVVLPREALVTMTVYDLDTSDDYSVVEQITVPRYEYFKTPLRCSDGSEWTGTGTGACTGSVVVNEQDRTFTATGTESSGADPTDPQALTDDQASKGVQFFFRGQDGYVDATFSVSNTGTGATCGGRNLLLPAIRRSVRRRRRCRRCCRLRLRRPRRLLPHRRHRLLLCRRRRHQGQAFAAAATRSAAALTAAADATAAFAAKPLAAAASAAATVAAAAAVAAASVSAAVAAAAVLAAFAAAAGTASTPAVAGPPSTEAAAAKLADAIPTTTNAASTPCAAAIPSAGSAAAALAAAAVATASFNAASLGPATFAAATISAAAIAASVASAGAAAAVAAATVAAAARAAASLRAAAIHSTAFASSSVSAATVSAATDAAASVDAADAAATSTTGAAHPTKGAAAASAASHAVHRPRRELRLLQIVPSSQQPGRSRARQPGSEHAAIDPLCERRHGV